MQRSVSYLCYYYYDWQANSRRKSFCLSSFHDPLPAKRCETTAIITIVPCHALCQQRFPSATGQLPPSAPSCFLVLPTIIASAIHSFIRAPLPAPSSIQFSSTHCSCSTRAARSTPALVAFCCHACVYTFTFTFTLRKHHFYATSNAQGFVASTAAATRRRDGSAKSVAYFAAHLVKLFICPNPLPLLFLSHSLVCLSLSLLSVFQFVHNQLKARRQCLIKLKCNPSSERDKERETERVALLIRLPPCGAFN